PSWDRRRQIRFHRRAFPDPSPGYRNCVLRVSRRHPGAGYRTDGHRLDGGYLQLGHGDVHRWSGAATRSRAAVPVAEADPVGTGNRGNTTEARGMKAWIADEFGGLDVMHYRDVPVPDPRAGQVRVKVHA